MISRRFRLLASRLPDDVVMLLFVQEMGLRFLQGLAARRRAARKIQIAWDLHIMMSLPELVPYVPVQNVWIVPYIHGPWILHEHMFDDDVEEVD